MVSSCVNGVADETPTCPSGVSVPGSCPAFAVQVRWEEWVDDNLVIPLMVQAALTVLFWLVLRPLYNWAFSRKFSNFKSCMIHYVGTHDNKEVPRGWFMVLICSIQLLASMSVLVVWVIDVYSRDVSMSAQIMLGWCAAINMLTYAVNRLQGGLSVASLWELNAIADVLTVTPTLLHVGDRYHETHCKTNWLSLHYLRSFCLLYAFMQLRATGMLKHSGVILQMIILAVLRIACLIFVMSGTIFILEVLGDPTYLQDSFVTTSSGDNISFFQMVYWIVVSLTTVGYGDFAPRTFLSRMITSVFIVIGVAYIFWVQFQFQEAWKANREGSGAYVPRSKNDQHVVVVLLHRGHAKSFSSLLGGFLDEILHRNHKKYWPNVVFLSPSKWDVDEGSTFNEWLRNRGYQRKVRNKIWWVVGEVALKKDMDRVAIGSSMLTFLVPDLNTPTPDKDDEQNIFTSIVIRDFFPHVRLRLMLLRPQSKELALQSGIEMSRCFSTRELKAHILAQNVRCHGILPMVTGMLKSADDNDEEQVMRTAGQCAANAPNERASRSSTLVGTAILNAMDRMSSLGSTGSVDNLKTGKNIEGLEPTDDLTWILEYVRGLSRSLVGFELAEECGGYSFGELVNAVFQETGAVLLGILDKNRVRLCPQDLVEAIGIPAGTICFAVAMQADCVGRFRAQDVDPDRWRMKMLQIRDEQFSRMKAKGPHLAAAALLGPQLLKSLLDDSEPLLSEDSDDDRSSASLDDHSVDHGLNTDAFIDQGQLVTQIDRRTIRRPSLGEISNLMSPAEFERHVSDKSVRSSQGIGGGHITSNTRLMRQESKASAKHSQTKKQAIAKVRELRASLNHGEELVVLLVAHGEVWQQVRTFVNALRADYLPFVRPIVIMTPTGVPEGLLDDSGERIFTLVGSCTKAQQLIEAGVLEASAIVVMTGDASAKNDEKEIAASSIFKDSRVAMTAQVLECWCGISSREIFVAYELQESMSARHLPDLVLKPSACISDILRKQMTRKKLHVVDRRLGHHLDQDPSRDTSDMHLSSDFSTGLEKSEASILFHPRFMAGQVFTPELWGAMLGRMFYMPATIELIEALIMPHRRNQMSFPWQIRVPPAFVGRPYTALVQALALGTWWTDLAESMNVKGSDEHGGFFRSTSKESRKSAISGGSNFSRQLSDLQEGQPARNLKPSLSRTKDWHCGAVVALALHRRRSELRYQARSADKLAQGTGGFNYIVLVAARNTVLHWDDWVLVLGSKKFGKKANEMGLLRGSTNAHLHMQVTMDESEDGGYAFDSPSSTSETDRNSPMSCVPGIFGASMAGGENARDEQIGVDEAFMGRDAILAEIKRSSV